MLERGLQLEEQEARLNREKEDRDREKGKEEVGKED